MADDITVKDGLIYGGWRRPANPAAHLVGSIHDDAMAQKLGMRGGTVGGNNHLELFPPLVLKAFGPRWFERGSVSIYFLDPTLDREEVRAVMGVPPEGVKDAQVVAWIERPDGRKIGEGTVAVGDPDVLSALHARKLDRYESEPPRLLAHLKAGDELPSVEVTIPQETERRLELITDRLAWYTGDSPWGGPIATASNTIFAMAARVQVEAVALYGAIELRNVNGPAKVGVPYRAGGKVAYVGTSPKTEYFWHDSYLDDIATGKRVVEMRMLLRYMKLSSALYQ